MPFSQLEIEGHSIVLLGSFNPQIFQPSWFGNEGLIRKEEADSAKIEIVHRDLVSFSTETFRVEVFPERVLFATSQPQFYDPLRDLALGTFRVLRHTPVEKMGINRDLHYRMESEEAWHSIGNRLAPKGPWANLLKEPGLKGLSIQGSRADNFKGAVIVRVEPSGRVKPGVFITINDHYDLETESGHGADKMLDALEAAWKFSLDRSLEIAEGIVARQ